MKKNEFKVLGVMSGTSLDGIDLAYVHFNKQQDWEFQVITAETLPYTSEWKKKLTQAINFNIEDLKMLDENYTSYLAGVISEFIKKHEITDLDAVCSHGHTVKHEPENGITLQIGNLPELAVLTGQTVICDFRVQDVALGGQGAPLVPVGDELLFPQYKYCLNLGGFANISTSEGGKRIAYDICPVNTVLNQYAEKLGFEFDKDGDLARSGQINPELLEELEGLSFYKLPPPKSLGIEWVNKEVLPILKKYESDIPSVLRTYCMHIALQISKELGSDPSSEVLVSGGGCFNVFLLQQLKKMTSTKLVIPSIEIINYKEALIFGFLGVLRLREEINVISSVTGAEQDHSSGMIYLPS
ncbi:MAG: anhydro-N-acetylmuramic acid kinase [Bacteroidota bacterium]